MPFLGGLRATATVLGPGRSGLLAALLDALFPALLAQLALGSRTLARVLLALLLRLHVGLLRRGAALAALLGHAHLSAECRRPGGRPKRGQGPGQPRETSRARKSRPGSPRRPAGSNRR